MKQYLIMILLFVGITTLTIAKPTWQNKVAPSILASAEAGESIDFFITLSTQADISAAKQLPTKAAKGQYVFETLQAHANLHQAPIKAWLAEQGIAYQSFFIANTILVKHADLSILQALAQRTDIESANPNPYVQEIEEIRPPSNLAEQQQAGNSREGIEWGVHQVNAPTAWGNGYLGQGIVVGGQDTGYFWEHESIINQYRGWDGETANHSYNWHDAIHEANPNNEEENWCGLDITAPCDDNTHGTHTMGTMVGDDGAGNQIGVAPQAQWIGCRNMEQGWGTPATYIECFEWFLAPTDVNNENPDPSKAPHVINNSWSCPVVEGCNEGNWDVMRAAVVNLKAAGVVVVVSAGNTGDDCETVVSPPAIFEESISVGAIHEGDSIAEFSARGPVSVDNSYRLKPDIVAPGVEVLSAVNWGTDIYFAFEGTSMASPHVAGVVALLLSANPGMIGHPDSVAFILKHAAVQAYTSDGCGNDNPNEWPNNTFGYGLIDANAAIELSFNPPPLNVGITDAITSNETNVSLYPNPFKEQFTINIPTWEGTNHLTLYNIKGQKVHEQSWEGNTPVMVSLEGLAAGAYFYRVRNDVEGVVEGKVVKE